VFSYKKAIELHHHKQAIAASKKVWLRHASYRKIPAGGGRKPKLSLEEQIILTLTYLRHSATFQLLGIQFSVSETTANNVKSKL